MELWLRKIIDVWRPRHWRRSNVCFRFEDIPVHTFLYNSVCFPKTSIWHSSFDKSFFVVHEKKEINIAFSHHFAPKPCLNENYQWLEIETDTCRIRYWFYMVSVTNDLSWIQKNLHRKINTWIFNYVYKVSCYSVNYSLIEEIEEFFG